MQKFVLVSLSFSPRKGRGRGFSNTDDASHPDDIPKNIRAKAPEVKAIATTATPDGAGSQTQEMGETSSDSDGGEDQDQLD